MRLLGCSELQLQAGLHLTNVKFDACLFDFEVVVVVVRQASGIVYHVSMQAASMYNLSDMPSH